MKLRQLHYIYEVTKRGLNVTAAADALFTSQPGVSKQIRLLEEELGVDIFVRDGKHLSEVTPAGQRILDCTQRLLGEVENIRRVADEFHDADRGDLAIATTHTQARYALPPIIHAFRSEEHTYELQSTMRKSYAVFCLQQNKIHYTKTNTIR